ncbi:MAG TPA: hypothetical protein PKC45_07735 [Gemmatales bacterium]|nr:hypothetical protein [Gemmatales bacterium]
MACTGPHSTARAQTPDPVPAKGTAQTRTGPIHIFILHGLDPFDLAGLKELRSYLAQQSVAEVKLFQFFQTGAVRECVLQARQADPTAQMAIIGFSAGTLTARRLVHSLHDGDQIDVDLLIYLGGELLDDSPYSRPTFIGEVVHILPDNYVVKGETIEGAVNYRVLGAGHFGAPMNPATLAVIGEHLRARIGRARPHVAPAPASVEPAPARVAEPAEALPGASHALPIRYSQPAPPVCEPKLILRGDDPATPNPHPEPAPRPVSSRSVKFWF